MIDDLLLVADELQRVYFGNWLRDYSQVSAISKCRVGDSDHGRLSILLPSAKSK